MGTHSVKIFTTSVSQVYTATLGGWQTSIGLFKLKCFTVRRFVHICFYKLLSELEDCRESVFFHLWFEVGVSSNHTLRFLHLKFCTDWLLDVVSEEWELQRTWLKKYRKEQNQISIVSLSTGRKSDRKLNIDSPTIK